MLPFIFVSSLLLGTANAQTVNCASFWASGSDGTINDNCIIYGGFPSVFSQNVKGTFAYVQAWQNDPSLPDLAEAVGQALSDATRWYTSLQAPLSNIVVILTKQNQGTTDALTTRPQINTGACQIQLYSHWYDPSKTDEYRMQVMAHEIYHCVQFAMFGSNSATATAPWWFESTAEFMSNAVYPTFQVEWISAKNYQPELTLYNSGSTQNTPDDTNIFFQAMANQPAQGALGVQTFVQMTGGFGDPGNERTRLAGYQGFADLFHYFGKQFALQQIMDSDGINYVPQDNPVLVIPLQLASTGPDDTTTTASMSAEPFTVNDFKISIDSGQTVTLAYDTTNNNVRVSYRLAGATYWTTMPTSEDLLSSGADGTVVAPCNTADGSGSVDIEILFTSTDDTDSAGATVTITQVSQVSGCSCGTQASSGGSQRRGWEPRRGLTGCTTPSPTVSASPTPTPSGTGSCNPVAGVAATDPCLSGVTWTIDIPTLEALMEQRLAGLAGETISSLSITGTGTLVVSGTKASFAYTDFTIDMDVDAEGLDVPTNTVVNGNFDANLYMQGGGAFCLDVYDGSGTAVETDDITGGFTIDLGPGGGFVEENYSITYTCQPGKLTMQGVYNGGVAWGPYAYKS